MSATALLVSRLTIRDARGDALVADIDLALQPGRALLLIGETGSGKSLIAQAVMGLLPPGFSASGTIAINGHEPVPASQSGLLRLFWARETMLLPQEPRAALDPTMRIGRQLTAPQRPMALTPGAALAAVGLAAETRHAFPGELSGGMAQRVLIASALVGSAPLLIADEPTKGLDAARIGQSRALLADLVARGRALLVITHDIALARAFEADVAVLHQGRIVEQGPVSEVLEAPRHPYTRAWLEADPAGWRPCLRCCAVDEPVLAAHALRFGYRRRAPLFADLELHVPAGGVLAVTGPSGCGKSTLGNILLGLQRSNSGTVSWQGIDPYRNPAGRAALRRAYQKLHQDPASVFMPHRTIGRHFEDLAEVVPDLALARELPPLLERLKLDERLLLRHAGAISGGEAQRLALARILLLRPALVIADEPTSRLDPLVQRQTMLMLRDIVMERQIGLILIGHDRNLLAASADEILDLSA